MMNIAYISSSFGFEFILMDLYILQTFNNKLDYKRGWWIIRLLCLSVGLCLFFFSEMFWKGLHSHLWFCINTSKYRSSSKNLDWYLMNIVFLGVVDLWAGSLCVGRYSWFPNHLGKCFFFTVFDLLFWYVKLNGNLLHGRVMTVSFHKYGDLFFPGTGDVKVLPSLLLQ